MDKIIMLGTGAGSAIKFYNACFALQKDNEYMLIDGGGGINILEQLDKANIPIEFIKNILRNLMKKVMELLKMYAKLQQN